MLLPRGNGNVAAKIGINRVIEFVHLFICDLICSIACSFIHLIYILNLPYTQHWKYKVKCYVVVLSRRRQSSWSGRLKALTQSRNEHKDRIGEGLKRRPFNVIFKRRKLSWSRHSSGSNSMALWEGTAYSAMTRTRVWQAFRMCS